MKKIKPDGSKTIYIGGVYEVDKSSGGAVTKTTVYYPAGGAMRVNGTLYFVLKDHLGSASVVTDATGNIVGEQRYYPYGETRFTSGALYTDKLFTGQREMAGLGIYHYGARFYSQKLGRFLSPDTLVPDQFNPQAFNHYSYVFGNPLLYTDPDGHHPLLVYGGIAFAIVAAVVIVVLIVDAVQNGEQNQGDVPISENPWPPSPTFPPPPVFEWPPLPSLSTPTNCPPIPGNCDPTPTPSPVYGPVSPPTSSPTNTGTSTGTSTNTPPPSNTSTPPVSTPSPTPPIFIPAPPKPGGFPIPI